jgi:hypothetical protein
MDGKVPATITLSDIVVQHGKISSHSNHWEHISFNCMCYIPLTEDSEYIRRNAGKLMINLRYLDSFTEDQYHHIYIHLKQNYYADSSYRQMSSLTTNVDTDITEFMTNLEGRSHFNKILKQGYVSTGNFVIHLNRVEFHFNRNTDELLEELSTNPTGGIIFVTDYSKIFEHIEQQSNGISLVLCDLPEYFPISNDSTIVISPDDLSSYSGKHYDRIFIFNANTLLQSREYIINLLKLTISYSFCWLIDDTPNNVYITKYYLTQSLLNLTCDISNFITNLKDSLVFKHTSDHEHNNRFLYVIDIPYKHRLQIINLKNTYQRLKQLINKVSGNCTTEKALLRKQRKTKMRGNQIFTKSQLTAAVNPNTECSICINNMTDPVILLNCSHIFCSSCLIGNVTNKCPLCRETYTQTQIYNCTTVTECYGYMMEEILSICNSDLNQNIIIYINGHISISKRIKSILKRHGRHKGNIIALPSENFISSIPIHKVLVLGQFPYKLCNLIKQSNPDIYEFIW